jgi:hypothetical protein
MAFESAVGLMFSGPAMLSKQFVVTATSVFGISGSKATLPDYTVRLIILTRLSIVAGMCRVKGELRSFR